MSLRRWVPLFVLALVACNRRSEPPPQTTTYVPRSAAPKPSPPTPQKRPRLVVVIVLDQVPSWALDKYRDALAEDGAIRKGTREGASYVAAYPYSTTFTGPGHATLFTGAVPKVSGITGNQIYDRSTHAMQPTVSDARYPVLGDPKATASPVRLRVPTVGDALKKATNGAARVAALSLKDRASVLPGGQAADLALWYDAAIPGFTTSTFYAPSLPEWLTEWQRRHPIAAQLRPWTPLEPEVAARLAGADDGAGEGDWAGLGTTFPHDPNRSSSAFSVLRATPAGTDYLLGLTREVIDRLELGKDAIPDLLTVSISGTDYVGHVFGPDSWEYFDNLLRVDRWVGAFTEEVARRTDAAFLVTSDHGVGPLPEHASAQGRPSGRLFEGEIREVLETRLDSLFGPSDWIEAIDLPFIYLTGRARHESRRAQVMEALKAELGKSKGVERVVDVRALSESETDPIRAAISASVSDRVAADADAYVVASPGFIMDAGLVPGKGTNHGTPWPYDREVPLVVWGASVSRSAERSTRSALDVAPSIAALLGILPPAAATGAALPAIQRPPRLASEAATPP